MPTVTCTSAKRLPHKANIDASVYTRQDLFKTSNVVRTNAKYRILPFGTKVTIQKLKINKKPPHRKQQYRKQIKQHGFNTSNLVQLQVELGQRTSNVCIITLNIRSIKTNQI